MLIRTGKILGQHKGYPFYTIGQRKGLDIALGKPVFVTKIDPETNTVVLGDEEDLEQNEMIVGKMNWIKYDGITPMAWKPLQKSVIKIKGISQFVSHEGNGNAACVFMKM